MRVSDCSGMPIAWQYYLALHLTNDFIRNGFHQCVFLIWVAGCRGSTADGSDRWGSGEGSSFVSPAARGERRAESGERRAEGGEWRVQRIHLIPNQPLMSGTSGSRARPFAALSLFILSTRVLIIASRFWRFPPFLTPGPVAIHILLCSSSCPSTLKE